MTHFSGTLTADCLQVGRCEFPSSGSCDKNRSFDPDKLQTELQAWKLERQTLATSLGTVTWAVFNAAPQSHAGKRVLLAQSDFATGTLRVRAPCLLTFTENVTFAPMPSNDFLPDPSTQPQYAGSQYLIGFFAAIAVESNDVLIDGQNFTLKQTDEFKEVER